VSSEAWTSEARMEEWVTTRFLTLDTIVEIGTKSIGHELSSLSKRPFVERITHATRKTYRVTIRYRLCALRVPVPRSRELLNCSETACRYLCAWRRTLRWCCGTTRTVVWRLESSVVQRQLQTTADGVTDDSDDNYKNKDNQTRATNLVTVDTAIF